MKERNYLKIQSTMNSMTTSIIIDMTNIKCVFYMPVANTTIIEYNEKQFISIRGNFLNEVTNALLDYKDYALNDLLLDTDKISVGDLDD